jgi:hypothetical protein
VICAEEFKMADQAFALSPISARATQPSEEDYDAISEAFMETARGRWFLGEYAKRNRNADTRMVLDAVARIEQALAAQKTEPPDNGLAEALAAIGSAVERARTATSAALDGFALEAALAPVRKGIRVIREISWRWREIGADGRICDLIDSQIGAVEAGCERISSSDPGASLHAAFDLISREIDKFGDRKAASPAVEEANIPASDAVKTPAVTETEPPATASRDAPASITASAVSVDAGMATAELTAEAADARDEAVLDLIAFEMAAPDPADADADTFGDDVGAAKAAPAEPETIAGIDQATAATIEPFPEPMPLQASLGSTLVASGIVRRPVSLASDPLAPIRRLTQAEKIALFS